MKGMDELRKRIAEIRAEMEELNELEEMNDDDESRFAELMDEFDVTNAELTKLEDRQKRLEEVRQAAERAAVVEPGATTEHRADPVPQPRDPFDGWRDASRGEIRSRAIEAVEKVPGVEDGARQELISKLDGSSKAEIVDRHGSLPRLVLATSNDDYRSAWAKLMGGRNEASLTPDERRALSVAEETRAALGLTQSGYAVPAVIDPTVVLTSAGSIGSIRQVSRVIQVTANSWKPITSGGVTASWDGELAEVSDDTPTLAQPEITAHKAQAFAQVSVEFDGDWADYGNELVREFADAKEQLEAVAFVSGAGDGSNQPFGITTELDGGTQEIGPATGETFAVADVYSTIEGVKPRWRTQNLTVHAELSTINAMRQFATANNYHAFLTDLGGGNPQRLLGYDLYENSSMDAYSDLNPAVTADNFLIVAGDFRNYVIIDRIGLSVEFIPHMFNTANNLPDGRRGWYCYWRVGAESIVDNAFAMLSIPTTL